MLMKMYDYIFAGGGLSGTMLAYLLLQSTLKNSSILIIDSHKDNWPDRNWSFWSKDKTPFDHIIEKQWISFLVSFDDSHKEFNLEKYKLSLLSSRSYFEFIKKTFSQFKNVEMVSEKVSEIVDEKQWGKVKTENEEYLGKIVFDSILKLPKKQNRILYMQGLQSEITTHENIFDDSFLTFLDFRGTPQDKLLFFYVLPISPKRAFIECAHVVSNKVSDHPNYESLLHTYIKTNLNLKQFQVSSITKGKILMTDFKFARYLGKHIFSIGANGGMVNQTTSYGFMNILKDSQYIVDSLEKTEKPAFLKKSWIESYLNSIILELMEQKPAAIKQMYKDLFEKNKNGDDILGFLQSENSLLKNYQLLRHINPQPISYIIQDRIRRKL